MATRTSEGTTGWTRWRRRGRFNTRRWSTPLIIGAALFSAATGLLMFFYVVAPFKFAHELMGLVFTVAIVLHVVSNFKPFRKHLTKWLGAAVVALVLSGAVGLLVLTMNDHSLPTRNAIVERVGEAPVPLVATLLGMETEELVAELARNGIVVDDPAMTIAEVAQRYDGDVEDVLRYVLEE